MNINWLVLPTLLLGVLLFVVGQWSMRRCRTRGSRAALLMVGFVLGLPGFLFPLYYLHFFDDAPWFLLFRALPYTELTAAGAGLFAGSLSALVVGPRTISRPMLFVLLCLGLVAPHAKPLLVPLPARSFSDRWQDDVCRQSTSSSCGPASAATIFRLLGTNVSERDIARECFTYLGGTENWYLARAFRRRGFEPTYRVVAGGLPADLHTPAIAGVRIGTYGHFIAILSRTSDGYVTGDPLIGRREYTRAGLTNSYTFTGFFLEIAPHN